MEDFFIFEKIRDIPFFIYTKNRIYDKIYMGMLNIDFYNK